MKQRTMVACVGNIFLGDDGFGVEVARALAGRQLPGGAQVHDIGIRGIHLAYELLDGCDLLILVDAAPHGAPPGTVSVLDPAAGGAGAGRPVLDAHGLAPDDVFALLDQLDAKPRRTLVVACQPGEVAPGIGLSDAVAAAVPAAVEVIEELLRQGVSAAH